MDLVQENKEKSMKIRLKFSIRNCIKSYYYSIIFKFKEEDIKNKDQKTLFETEQIKCKQNESLIEFKNHFCCDYYFYKVQKILVQVKKLKNVGESYLKYFTIENNTFDLSSIISSKNGLFQIAIDDSYNPLGGLREILMIKVENDYEIDNNISIRKNNFIDYILSGIHLKNFICIDFSDKELLEMNQLSNHYLNSILGFRETLNNFSRKYEVYGFDYVLKNKNDNEDFLNFDKDDEELEGYTSISYAYYQFLLRLDLSDKIIKKEKKNKLSSLISHISKKIFQKKSLNEYNLIFILINSLNEAQFQDCIDCFIKASFLPISFIIIGIGNDENKFVNMKKLCEIKKIKKGLNKLRDNTFFISMKECENKSEIIKNKCLIKIPEQICEFYEINKISLNDIKESNQNNKESIAMFDAFNSLMQQHDFKVMNDNPAPSSIEINNNQQNSIQEEPKNEITPENFDNNDTNIDINIDINNKKNKNNFPNKHKKSSSKKKLSLSSSKKSEGNKFKKNENIKNDNN